MQVELRTPTAIEGDWHLIDADGKIIATSKDHQGALLIIEPFFYKGTYSQILARTRTLGKKGKEMSNALRVAAQTGKITSELATALPAKIVPKFDTANKEDHKAKAEK
jgi:hypothetical protein